MADKIFPEGMRIDAPREGAPDFVRGRIGIEVEKLIPFLEKHKNDRGWVNLDILKSKDKGVSYLQLNDYKPLPKVDYPEEGNSDPNNIPF